MMDERPHDKYCWKCDMAEFASMTYQSAHIDATSPNRCCCGVVASVSHFCSALGHAWVAGRKLLRGCIYHRDDPYPAGCADCSDEASGSGNHHVPNDQSKPKRTNVADYFER
jgi:hypothetical protein